MQRTILVTGGAGYIGSNTAYYLYQQGFNVIILDSLRYNQRFNFPWATCVKGDIGDSKILNSIFDQYPIEAVFHFAGLIEVGASVKDPQVFYRENVKKTLVLFESMLSHNVKKIIFSSTAAVYGIPKSVPILENSVKNPINPYGKTKLAVEGILADYNKAYNLRYAVLRYFNAAGANVEAGLGEFHDPETHLIPNILRSVRDGQLFTLFGDDYNTPDGSCIRDYLHVKDLATAHYKALEHLTENSSFVGNLGTGTGVSNKQIVKAAERVVGQPVTIKIQDRRPGDPDMLVADAEYAQRTLDWAPAHSDINTIIQDAWLYMHQGTLSQSAMKNSISASE